MVGGALGKVQMPATKKVASQTTAMRAIFEV